MYSSKTSKILQQDRQTYIEGFHYFRGNKFQDFKKKTNGYDFKDQIFRGPVTPINSVLSKMINNQLPDETNSDIRSKVVIFC